MKRMTELGWDTCTDPWTMLVRICRDTPPVRKLRLFAVASCRRVEWLFRRTKLAYRAVLLAGRMAEIIPSRESFLRFLQDEWKAFLAAQADASVVCCKR